VLFVGTWDGRKRGRFLHELFRTAIRPAMPDAELWMVSDECEPGEGVTHFAAPDDDLLLSLYRRAWVFCLPSTYEGFGIPYLEAMASGAAVVSTRNPGAQYVTRDGEAGLLVGDAELGAAVLGLLRDSKSRTALASRGRLVAKDFSWEAAVHAHEHAYYDAIEEFRR
jgi:glycosyltransferase involved in cell wall biosynthesis